MMRSIYKYLHHPFSMLASVHAIIESITRLYAFGARNEAHGRLNRLEKLRQVSFRIALYQQSHMSVEAERPGGPGVK